MSDEFGLFGLDSPTFSESGYWGGQLPGDWTSGMGAGLGGASGGFDLGGFLNKNSNWLIPGAMMGMSALGGTQQPKVNYATPPVNPTTQQAMNNIMGMANQGFNAPETWNRTLNKLQSMNVQRGLVPNASSGAFQRTLSDAMAAKAEEDRMNQAKLYQMAGGMAPQAQAFVQQPTPSVWQNLASSYLQNVMAQNQQNQMQSLLKAYTGQSMPNFSWFPWGQG